MLLSNCVVCGKKNQILLKIKNFTVLIIFQISLKWRHSELETNLCHNCIQNKQNLHTVLVDHFLNIVVKFKNLEREVIKNIYIDMN